MSATAAGDGGPGSSDLLREERVAGAGVRVVSWPEGLRADVTAEIALLAAALADAIGEEKVASSLILVSFEVVRMSVDTYSDSCLTFVARRPLPLTTLLTSFTASSTTSGTNAAVLSRGLNGVVPRFVTK